MKNIEYSRGYSEILKVFRLPWKILEYSWRNVYSHERSLSNYQLELSAPRNISLPRRVRGKIWKRHEVGFWGCITSSVLDSDVFSIRARCVKNFIEDGRYSLIRASRDIARALRSLQSFLEDFACARLNASCPAHTKNVLEGKFPVSSCAVKIS